MRENSQNSAGSTSQLNFNSWTVEQVGNWLSNNDFGEYRQQFAEHNITGDLLLQLNYTWLKDVGVIVVGDRARILQAIQRQFLKYNQDAAKTVTYASKSDRSDNSFADANTKAENRKGLLPPPNDKSPRSSAIHRSNHGGHRKYASDDKLDMRSSRFDKNNESSIETTPRQMRKASTEKANPIQIYPRTSSRKESNSNKQLNEAYDVIFGSSSPKSAAAHPTPPLSGSSPRLATHPVQAIISSPKPPSGRVSKTSVKSPKSTETPTLLERDVMKMKFIREKCIRVTGDDNQGHVVTVEGLKSGADIRKKVLSKFGISTDSTEWIIATFSPPNTITALDNKDLYMICVTDNEFRANLLLRKIEAKKLPVESVKLEIGTRRSKLTKILGADPTMSPGRSNAEPVTSPNRTPSEAIDDFKKFFGLDKSKEGSSPKHSPKESPKISPNETRPVFKKSNKTRSIFFGERPPDELIVDQLEQFFPNINSDDLALPKQNIQLKNIVAENIKKKRDSKRMSSVMLRRQSGVRVTSLESKRITPVIPEDEAADATEAESSATPPQVVTPASVAPVIRWTPGQLIGQGAFGKVFHALNLDTGDFMAVKQVIGGDDSQQKKSFDSLKREIELLRELTHDNIVQYLGYETKDNTFNVFLEYISGGSISSCLAKCGKFPENITRSFAAQILCGLEYLHERKIIHRDIKGANILITGDGIVKISDFGISKKNEYAAYNRMTRMSMQGSILWMAPEVARGKGYSAKVDIWSTGCLILEMLTGNLPWHKAQGNIIFLLGKGNAPPIPTNLTAFSTEFLNLTFTIEADKRPTASELLDNPYTDIDPLSVDFKQWSETAIQLKADGGSTSEDISPLTEGDEELSDDDSETIEDINDFNVFNQPNVDFSTTFSGATEIESKLDDGPAKNVEDDSAEDDLYGWTQSLGPEEARNLQELLNLGKRL